MADYALEGVRWATNQLTWSFATTNYSNQSSYAPITQTFFAVGQTFINDVIWAFQRWSAVSGLGFTQVTDSANVDIRLGWAIIDGLGGTAGIASYSYDSSGYLQPNNVIVFDSGDTWVLGADNDYHAQSPNGTSFRAIALHEIGHELGLDHYSGDAAIMNPAISPTLNDLTQHDINGIQALYGGPANALNAAYRFYDMVNGDHFYTISSNESTQIQRNQSNRYRYEGAQWSTPNAGAGTTSVYRFFDTSTGNHFYTTNTSEKDGIIAARNSYQYEGVAFQAYTASASGTVTLERFYNNRNGLHHLSANADETAWIRAGGAGPGWVDEGAGFIVHTPA